MIDVLICGTDIHYSITHVDRMLLMEIAEQHPGATLLIVTDDEQKKHLGAAVAKASMSEMLVNEVQNLILEVKCIEEPYMPNGWHEEPPAPAGTIRISHHTAHYHNAPAFFRRSMHPP